jgi:hypothetical protein
MQGRIWKSVQGNWSACPSSERISSTSSTTRISETYQLPQSPQFGQATQMLASSLGSGGQSGGLNPLYQIGGPRSVQLAVKLLF